MFSLHYLKKKEPYRITCFLVQRKQKKVIRWGNTKKLLGEFSVRRPVPPCWL